MDNEEKDQHQNTKQPPKRIDPNSFPHRPSNPGRPPPATIENLEHLLEQGGFACRFNVIKKRTELRHADGTRASMSEIVSFALQNAFGTGWLYQFIDEIAAAHPYNPVEEWIRSKAWDGKDRLPEIYDTIIPTDEYPAELKETLLRRWLLSVTQAALAQGPFRARGVLTLQGEQGIGKTSWIGRLLPPGELRNDYILLDHHMDGSNKDSVINAVTHFIVEIGELDSSFKKDIARLKGFLTNDCDKFRKPYGREVVEHPRRTVFAATVNDDRFLVDSTGNSRWWTIAIHKMRWHHDVDMQQLYAQLAVALEGNERWWLTPAEERQLAEYNLRHRSVSAIAERVLEYADPDSKANGHYMTAIEVLRAIGITNPTTAQCRECGAALRECFGPPSRVNGRHKWKVKERDNNIY
jgi:putative DNA primase/helicase